MKSHTELLQEYKSQGLTLGKVVMDVGDRETTVGTSTRKHVCRLLAR